MESKPSRSMVRRRKWFFYTSSEVALTACEDYLEQTPSHLVDDVLSRYLPTGADIEANRKALFDHIMNNVGQTDAGKIWERLAQVQPGSVTATQLLTSKPTSGFGSQADHKQIADYVQQHPNGAPQAGSTDFLQAGVAGALGAACPTAGVAIKMATILSNLRWPGE